MKSGYSGNPGDGLFKYSPDSGTETPGSMSYDEQLSSYDKSNAPKVGDEKMEKKRK